jgi:hypothetical protein
VKPPSGEASLEHGPRISVPQFAKEVAALFVHILGKGGEIIEALLRYREPHGAISKPRLLIFGSLYGRIKP